MKRPSRIMVYGTYLESQAADVEPLLTDFVAGALHDRCTFLTRGGTARGSTRKWNQPKDGVVPVDNVVLEALRAGIADAGEIKKRVRTYTNRNRSEPVNVGQEMLSCPDLRYEMYSCFLDDADIFVFVGGGDGVVRLGLLCHFLDRPFVALTRADGGAKELAESFYRLDKKGHYQNLTRDDCLRLESEALTGPELYEIVRHAIQPRLAVATHDAVRGRMRLSDYSSVVIETIDHWAGVIGKVVLGVLACAPIYFVFRSEVEDLYGEVLSVMLKFGLLKP